MKKLIAILFIFSTLSCSTLVDDLPLSRFPEIKAKLVMASFISPSDSLIVVRVSESTPLFGDFKIDKTQVYITPQGDTIYNYIKNAVVKNAIVKLSDGKSTVTLPYNDTWKAYITTAQEFPIKNGVTYTLTAENSLGKAEASTTVPSIEIPLKEWKIDTTSKFINILKRDSTGNFWAQEKVKTKGYLMQGSWQDEPTQENFYRLEVYVNFFMEVPLIENNKIVYKKIQNNQRARWSDDFYSTKNYIDDLGKDATLIKSPKGELFGLFEDSYYSGFQFGGKYYAPKPIDEKNLKVVFSLQNTSKEYYLYHTSLFKYLNASGNPFAEPVSIYSNVKNGLGIFAGFNENTKSEYIK